MVKAEQLLCGYFKGYGLRVLKSPRLNSVLCEESVTALLRLGAEKTTEAMTLLWKDKQVAYSLLIPQVDEQDRRAVWNHSIVMSIEDCLRAKSFSLPFLTPGQEQTKLETVEV